MKKFVIFCIISIIVLSSVSTLSNEINQNLIIELDCAQIDGIIRHFGGINCGPLPNHDVKDGIDLTEQYQDVGIDFIRTHDFGGPTDISTIFPNFSADPNLESSYDFKSSDRFITGIINAGCKVFYRLGESASVNNSLRQPPENFSKWAEICKHIVMHYNDGWADGYHYNITYWEIWNEPDLVGFWTGTVEEYYELYHVTVQKLKSYDSSLKIGGPCTSSIENNNYTTGFLSYIEENNLPLDFYSWHMYAYTPYQLYNASLNVRNILDTFGFIGTESINTEWNINIGIPQRDKDNSKNAAFTACALAVFQDAGIDHAFRYRSTQDNNWLMRFIGFDLSLFSYDGLYKTPALTYKAMHYITCDTPIRLITPIMDSSNGITYLAGISEDKSNITVLISNFEAEDVEYTLNIENLPWNSSYRVLHYLIDDETHLEITEDMNSDSHAFSLTKTIKTSTVNLFRLTNSSSMPDEGPPTASIPLILRLKIFDPIAALLGILFMILFFA